MKPTFFSDVDLCELSPYHRLLFAGLWCWADREGRLPDRPKQIKHDILPFDEDCGDVDSMLSDLTERGFIKRYISEGKSVIEITNFEKHQNPHPREVPSVLPIQQSRVITRPEISSRDNKMPARQDLQDLLSPIPSGSSVTPPPAVAGESSHVAPSFEDLHLEDSITDYLPNAYRRNGRPRPKLTRRQDAPLVQRIEESEAKHGAEFFRRCLLVFLATENAWLRENGWPIARFLQNPEAYAPPEGGEPAPGERGEDDDAPEDVAQPPAVAESPSAAVRRDWLAEWNRLVPEQETEYNPKKSPLLAIEAAGVDFRENFDQICAAAKAVIARDGKKATYITLYWLCSYKDGENRTNWWRLLFGNLQHMTVASSAKSNVGENVLWKPGMPADTVEQHRAYVVWKEDRKARGLHTDPDKAAAEGIL